MTYKLAKQLKDAGFRQILGQGYAGKEYEDQESVYFPTLSELIEACGDDKWLVIRYAPFTFKGVTWVAIQSEELLDPTNLEQQRESAFGKTPEEAVAKLWLALNASPKDSLT